MEISTTTQRDDQYFSSIDDDPFYAITDSDLVALAVPDPPAAIPAKARRLALSAGTIDAIKGMKTEHRQS